MRDVQRRSLLANQYGGEWSTNIKSCIPLQFASLMFKKSHNKINDANKSLFKSVEAVINVTTVYKDKIVGIPVLTFKMPTRACYHFVKPTEKTFITCSCSCNDHLGNIMKLRVNLAFLRGAICCFFGKKLRGETLRTLNC